MSAQEPIYVTDLGQSRPQLALSSERRKYHWQVVPYETESFCGNMLIAGPETEAPPITVPLGVSGWHSIHIGMWSNWTDDLARVKTIRRQFILEDKSRVRTGNVCRQLLAG